MGQTNTGGGTSLSEKTKKFLRPVVGLGMGKNIEPHMLVSKMCRPLFASRKKKRDGQLAHMGGRNAWLRGNVLNGVDHWGNGSIEKKRGIRRVYFPAEITTPL